MTSRGKIAARAAARSRPDRIVNRARRRKIKTVHFWGLNAHGASLPLAVARNSDGATFSTLREPRSFTHSAGLETGQAAAC